MMMNVVAVGMVPWIEANVRRFSDLMGGEDIISPALACSRPQYCHGIHRC